MNTIPMCSSFATLYIFKGQNMNGSISQQFNEQNVVFNIDQNTTYNEGVNILKKSCMALLMLSAANYLLFISGGQLGKDSSLYDLF